MQEINGKSDEGWFRQSAFFASASIYPFVMMLVLDSNPHPIGVWAPLIGAALSVMAGATRTRAFLVFVPIAILASSFFAVMVFTAAVNEADFSDPMVLVPFAASLVAWPLIALVISSLAARAGLHNVTLTPGAVTGFAAVVVVFALLSILRFAGIFFTLGGEPVLFF